MSSCRVSETLLMIRLHVWRLAVGRYGETTRLTLSAVVLMAVEWLVLAAAPSIALLVIYAVRGSRSGVNDREAELLFERIVVAVVVQE
jgi:hypothetical protein